MNDLQRCREGAGPQHDGQIVGLLGGERPRNLRPPSGNPFLDDRRGIDGVIQHHGHALFDMFRGDALELLPTLGIEGDRHVRIVELADGHPRVAQDIAGQHHAFLDHVGGAKFNPRVLVNHPLEQDLIAFRQFALKLLQHLSLFVLRHMPRQVQPDVFIQHFEFEQRGFLDQILGALGILDARELDDDLLQALPLYDRFRDPELIDSVSDRFQCLIDRRILDALGLRLAQHPYNRRRRFRRFVFDEARKAIDQLLGGRLGLGIWDLNCNVFMSDPLDRVDDDLLLRQEVLQRRDRSIHRDFHGTILIHLQYHMDAALQIQPQGNALVRQNRLQPARHGLIERRVGRKK